MPLKEVEAMTCGSVLSFDHLLAPTRQLCMPIVPTSRRVGRNTLHETENGPDGSSYYIRADEYLL